MELREQSAPVAKAAGGAKQERSRWRSDLAGFAFVLPFLVVYALFLIWPIILQFRMSFYDWSLAGTGTTDFLGLQNYRELLGDPAFWDSLWHTVYFTILTTPPLVILALVLAMLTNRIRSTADASRQVSSKTIPPLAQQLRDDRIDILI